MTSKYTVVPFESAKFAVAEADDLNNDLLAHASTGFPIISIKGKIFTISRGGEKKVIPNPKDPESPASSIEVVIVKASGVKSKVWYANGYTEGADTKPDCFSSDGSKPDSQSKMPQAKSCALCKHNQWGSKVGDAGATKGKACQDSVRIAVATLDRINDPYLIRVPPASIKSLGELGATCKKRGIGYNRVLTKVAMDIAAPTPKLLFTPVGVLPDEAYAEVREVAASDVVQNIIGSMFDSHEPEGDTPSVAAEAAVQAAVNKAKAAVKTAPAAVEPSRDPKVTDEEIAGAVAKAGSTPVKVGAVTETNELEIDMSNLSFDD
jgi:hypothetical protein